MGCRGRVFCQKVFQTHVIQREMKVVRVMAVTVEGGVSNGSQEDHIEDSSVEIY